MPHDVPDATRTHPSRRIARERRRRRAYLLLLAAFVALLAVPLYAREDPTLLGWPFFYWYQFAWGVITIVLMAFVYRVGRADAPDGSTERGDRSG